MIILKYFRPSFHKFEKFLLFFVFVKRLSKKKMHSSDLIKPNMEFFCFKWHFGKKNQGMINYNFNMLINNRITSTMKNYKTTASCYNKNDNFNGNDTNINITDDININTYNIKNDNDNRYINNNNDDRNISNNNDTNNINDDSNINTWTTSATTTTTLVTKTTSTTTTATSATITRYCEQDVISRASLALMNCEGKIYPFIDKKFRSRVRMDRSNLKRSNTKSSN